MCIVWSLHPRTYLRDHTCRNVISFFCWEKQGDGHEGPDHGQRSAEGPEDLQEDVLLHHAG